MPTMMTTDCQRVTNGVSETKNHTGLYDPSTTTIKWRTRIIFLFVVGECIVRYGGCECMRARKQVALLGFDVFLVCLKAQFISNNESNMKCWLEKNALILSTIFNGV